MAPRVGENDAFQDPAQNKHAEMSTRFCISYALDEWDVLCMQVWICKCLNRCLAGLLVCGHDECLAGSRTVIST